MKILVCNAGSTSLKYQLFEMPEERVLLKGKIEQIGRNRDAKLTITLGEECIVKKQPVQVCSHLESVRLALDTLVRYKAIHQIEEMDGVGFKTVHGGSISGTKKIDSEVLDALKRYITVAPLHNRIYVDIIESFLHFAPNLNYAAVFETAFHETMPEYAQTFGIPYEWKQKYGIRKYGFHGASHRYISQRVNQLTHPQARNSNLRVISCHLGGSSSLCAILNGRSIDATQSFSPQSGITMGTRNGDLDVYALFYLTSLGYSLEEINDTLYNHSGLLGISGISDDMQEIEQEAQNGNKRAQLAIDVYCYEIKKYLGAYWTILGGADDVVFTGGIGENSPFIRAKICDGLDHLGILLDPKKNLDGEPERKISKENSKVSVYVIPTNEEVIVARETMKLFQKKS